jgi:hypothetical protein
MEQRELRSDTQLQRQVAETRLSSRGGLVDPTIANLVTKDKIKQTLKRIDPEQRLDADVEDVSSFK